MDLFDITYWHWLSLAVILIIIELSTGTAIFLWLSAACLGVATVLGIWPDTIWQYQLAWYVGFVVLSIGLWKLYRAIVPSQENLVPHTLNQRSAQYVGRSFYLSEAIVNGMGKIRVDDSTWRVSGEDCPVDTKVIVVAAEGMILKVEKVEEQA